MTRMTRSKVEKLAETLGYTLSPAVDTDRMAAANLGEDMPRWTLNYNGNQRADQVKRCTNLDAAYTELDHIEIMAS